MVTKKDLKWMQLARNGAEIFSTCSKRKYFAIIIDKNGRCMGTGYNGGPPGVKHCVDGGCERAKVGSPNGSNYDNCIAIHAEANALLHSVGDTTNATLYVNGPPCFSCVKLIANSGIKRVVCLDDASYHDFPRIRRTAESWGLDIITISDAILGEPLKGA